MKNERTKNELRRALYQILEYARIQKDFSADTPDERRWDHVLTLAFNALNKPTLADLDKIRHQEAMSERQ